MHLARHLHTGNHDTKHALSAADKRSTTSFTTCMYPHHTTHNHYIYTNNVPYRTPESTPIDLVHTHHVTSSRVQIVVLKNKLHHVSMSSLSCPMGHCVSIIITAMEQGFHSGGQVFDRSVMAPCCSIVQGIASFLQKGKENAQHLS